MRIAILLTILLALAGCATVPTGPTPFAPDILSPPRCVLCES